MVLLILLKQPSGSFHNVIFAQILQFLPWTLTFGQIPYPEVHDESYIGSLEFTNIYQQLICSHFIILNYLNFLISQVFFFEIWNQIFFFFSPYNLNNSLMIFSGQYCIKRKCISCCLTNNCYCKSYSYHNSYAEKSSNNESYLQIRVL